MSSREEILKRVKANKPAATPLPGQVAFTPVPKEEAPAVFTKTVEGIGGIVNFMPDLPAIGAYLKKHFDGPGRILNTVKGVGFGTEATGPITEGHVLGTLEMAVVAGRLGVAENGAVWITEEDLPARVLPFICEHLALVIPQSSIVGTMHEAYATLDVAASGYGAFIAGASRTADIEQSLVIGAHGPKRVHVFIIQEAVS
ncbi:lactate utilization protein C [Pontibacter toksunensis]|uniref:Lactate utilization protein C n=1 Tax=Pontibacter toksunensis TaxID=1332631 RepID=A0ABW6C149_9BACT